MTGIVGVALTSEQVAELLRGYLMRYYEAMDKAIEAAGGSLQVGFGHEPWAPQVPSEIVPAWVSQASANHDGAEFYIDLSGPDLHDIRVAQEVVVHLTWDESGSRFTIVDVEVEPLRIRMMEQELDLDQARAASAGLAAAGKLMASLLEVPREVR